MTSIDIFENSDGDTYTFTIYQKGNITAEDLSNYTDVSMELVSPNLLTNYGTLSMDFDSKPNGIVSYTTDTLDPFPSIPSDKQSIPLLGQIIITGSGLKTITFNIEITYHKDFSTI